MDKHPRSKVFLKEGKTLAGWTEYKNHLKQSWPLQRYTRAQVALHCHQNDFWAIIGGLVYDLTAFLEYHPGGIDVLMPHAGLDITAEFSKRSKIFDIFLLDKYHPWVNYEALLEDGCLRGFIAD